MNQKRPGIRGAPFKSQPGCLRSLLLVLNSVAVAIADRNRTRLFGLGDLAHEVDVQEAVLEARALHLDEIGQLEHTLEGARSDALIEDVAALLLLLGILFAADGQRV